MPNNCRAMIHCHAKQGMKEELISLSEKQLLNLPENNRLHQREIWQDQNDPSHLIVSAVCKSEKETQDFQSSLKTLKPKLMQCCNEEIHEDLQKILQSTPDQTRRQEGYHVLLHYQAKPGMEKQLSSTTEQMFLKAPQNIDLQQAEFLQDAKNAALVTLSATCDSLEDVKAFQSNWESHKGELMPFCSQEPRQETYRINKSYPNKPRKTA